MGLIFERPELFLFKKQREKWGFWDERFYGYNEFWGQKVDATAVHTIVKEFYRAIKTSKFLTISEVERWEFKKKKKRKLVLETFRK